MRKTFALAAAAVALTGCGMLPGQQGGGGEERQTAATTLEQVEETAAETPGESAPPQQDQVIASRETKVASAGNHGTARADITGLKRQGRTATLSWTVTALDGKVNMHNGMGSYTTDFSVSAVSLIDPVNAKRYRVARNGTGQDAECVCSHTQGQFLEQDRTTSLYAVFAAPPADVTKVNVELPMIGVITDVPIS
ncbi:hypothetical protein [Nonomuraea aridisoli]|uniref:DUF4352 domain-containing protein n=1 Tax=Nonomuraea aridisoli TaxID=2070368 RepID=A0A2W2CY10_9ACTN|nr:hypothetical protein [Nonomuraea aridisoli]PZG04406.1 hypothetical protein C1J01_44650 [Nonomuraea aridisoli]